MDVLSKKLSELNLEENPKISLKFIRVNDVTPSENLLSLVNKDNESFED